MKKIFTLFTALLIAGAMFALDSVSTLTFIAKCGGTGTADDEVVWTITSDAAESNFDNTKGVHYGTGNAAVSYVNLATDQYVGKIKKVVVNASGANGTTAKICVKVGETAFQCNSNDTVSLTQTATNYTFVGEAEGAILISLHHASATKKAIYCKSVAVTFEKDETAPVLKADPLNFGTIKTENEFAVIDTVLEVTAANLTDAISVAASAESIVATEKELPAAGGTLHLQITAPAGTFSETLTLSSGEKEVVVAVTGKVLRSMTAPGAPATFSPGINATKVDSVTVNEHAAIKVGTSKNSGTVGIIVPAFAKKVYFFAAAWSGAAGNISLSSEDATLSLEEVSLNADAGVSGTSADFVLMDLGEVECFYEVSLSNVKGESVEIILTSGTAQRFVVWGATYEPESNPTAISNTEAGEKAVKMIVNGQLVIEKNGVRYNAMGQIVR